MRMRQRAMPNMQFLILCVQCSYNCMLGDVSCKNPLLDKAHDDERILEGDHTALGIGEAAVLDKNAIPAVKAAEDASGRCVSDEE